LIMAEVDEFVFPPSSYPASIASIGCGSFRAPEVEDGQGVGALFVCTNLKKDLR